MFPALREFVKMGKPVWGTCAGLIFLANNAVGQKTGGQELVGGLDCTVHRNFFGSQIQSFEADLSVPELAAKEGGPPSFRGVFIRAPAIMEAGPGVEVLADYPVQSQKPISPKSDAEIPEEKTKAEEKVIVAVKQGNLLGTAFHPELTADTRWHSYFLKMLGEGEQTPDSLSTAEGVDLTDNRPPKRQIISTRGCPELLIVCGLPDFDSVATLEREREVPEQERHPYTKVLVTKAWSRSESIVWSKSVAYIQSLHVNVTRGSGFTRLCKGLAVVLIGGSAVVQIFPSVVPYVALIPARTIPFAWNLITSGYIEQSIIRAVISTLGLLFIGRVLEPIWGSREFLKFIFVVNFLTSVCVFATAIALYYITTQENYLYKPLSGFHGVLLGFLVGIKQILPDQELSLFPPLKLKTKWLPSLLLFPCIVVSFFTEESASYLPTLIFGTYTSWIYLRYLQRKPETSHRGDPSDEFSFSSFFPGFLRPVIDPIASLFDRMFCGRSEVANDSKDGYTLGGTPLPGSGTIEASRRRERGARALEERLAADGLAVGGQEEPSHKDAAQNV
ncbi:Glutamine amidotransferase subunit PdxT [Macleaya cordata]|uniref:Glutamine amidotransferase subunit PdxT n=1 Tax=Macleaya cordata TaxID=56857 RepID=A0A200QI29_MACCD|nr:Glutamine amidotransferase subunit PdxT [Macleaya cordata]